jgi:adenine-specific DNA-methyltransferase
MSRLNDLLRELRAKHPALAADIEAEVKALADRRAFGLNFERHIPETVELPGRPVRQGDKVRILPSRGTIPKKANDKLWQVIAIVRDGDDRTAQLEAIDGEEAATVSLDDLVVVAEFRDPVYPGLVSTGEVARGGDKPYHTVINAENYYALQTLLFAYRGKVDCIYIDPPFNTRASDWKYNNDYVEPGDLYQHSKWLAFMERRLSLAHDLLNPEESVLLVAIDDNELHHLGLLLDQQFPNVRRQIVSITNSPRGRSSATELSQVDEYMFVLYLGAAKMEVPAHTGSPSEVRWRYLRRNDVESSRGTTKGGPAQFYPIYVDDATGRIVKLGAALTPDQPLSDVPNVNDATAVFPINDAGRHMNWGLTAPSLQKALDAGFVRVTKGSNANQPYVFAYLTAPNIKKIDAGDLEVTGTRPDGSKVVVIPGGKVERPTTVWRDSRYDAGEYGTSLISGLIPDRKFPFPKALYAVEDALRYFVGTNPAAIVVDFFAGSGTTAHAVMRLNRQDGGWRHSISVTNNEVSATEGQALRARGLRPGDPDWEKLGICDYITKPRINAAVTGLTPDGDSVTGNYKFTDEFPMADGFEENVEFFTLTYEAPLRVQSNREFGKIAPLLWMRAGSRGRRIDDLAAGWAVGDVYGVIGDLDQSHEFIAALKADANAAIAFIVTDEDRLFEAVVRDLPDHVEPVRLYEAYLRNFEIEIGRSTL